MLRHNASGHQQPRLLAGKTRSPAPRCGDAGLMDFNCGLRVRRGQRRRDGLRRLRWSQAGGTPRPAGPLVGACCWAVAVVTHGVMLLPVVVAAVMPVVSGDLEAGEEDGQSDEDDAGDDHNPRGKPVEPIGLDYLSPWRRRDRSRRSWCFRCFTHAEMMRGQRIGRARCNL